MSEVPIVILMGGQSRRMGTDKAFIDWHGKTMLQHQLDELSPLSNRIYLSVNEKQGVKLEHHQNCIVDRYPNQGPLGGILSCLEQLNQECIFVPIDMPNCQELVVKLLTQKGNTCFKTQQHTEPMPIRLSNGNIIGMNSKIKDGDLSILSYINDEYFNFITSCNKNLFLNVNRHINKSI